MFSFIMSVVIKLRLIMLSIANLKSPKMAFDWQTFSITNWPYFSGHRKTIRSRAEFQRQVFRTTLFLATRTFSATILSRMDFNRLGSRVSVCSFVENIPQTILHSVILLSVHFSDFHSAGCFFLLRSVKVSIILNGECCSTECRDTHFKLNCDRIEHKNSNIC